MGLHSEIRRRRQARIEQIRQMHMVADGNDEPPRISGMEESAERAASEPRPPARLRPAEARPPKDPEEAWKRRMADWSGQPSAHDQDDAGLHRKKGYGRFPAWGGLSFTSLLLSALLFIMMWGLFQLKESWAVDAQVTISSVLQEQFRTEDAAEWYHSVFGGSPSWIPVLRQHPESHAVHSELLSGLTSPVKGEIAAPFAENKQGVQILTDTDQIVQAVAEGLVVFSGQTSSGRTVVIQHPDQVRTVYGWLEDVTVAENDWVEQGDPIAGRVQQRGAPGKGVLYFAVRAGEQYVDPAEVVSLD